MPSQCCVRGCSVRGHGHMFPRDEARKKQWLIAIRKKNYKPSIYARVCRKHFTPEDYTLPKESVIENPLPVLKKDAVPSVFSWADTESDTGETNPKPKRKRTNKQAPVRPVAVYVSDNPVLKVPGLAQPIKAKLMRVPNDPSLIARLEAARKALTDKPKVLKADLGTKATSKTIQLKTISSSFKCLTNDSRFKKSLVNKSQHPNLNVNESNALIPSNKPIQSRQSPYTVPIKIQEIKVEKDTETEENELTHNSVNAHCDPLYTGCILSRKAIKIEKQAESNDFGHRTVDPAVHVDHTAPYVDHIMSVEKIKKDFVTVQCVEVEFVSKDKGVQCNIGDPCCSISLPKEPQFGLERYNIYSLKNIKKRRISI